MRISSIALLAALTLSGCAVTSDELRQDPAGTFSFDVDRDYLRVYRALLARTRHCYINAYGTVFGDIYPEKRAGEIAVTIFTIGGEQRTLLLVDVGAGSENQTKVKVTYLHSAARRLEPVFEGWASERNFQCYSAAPAEGA